MADRVPLAWARQAMGWAETITRHIRQYATPVASGTMTTIEWLPWLK